MLSGEVLSVADWGQVDGVVIEGMYTQTSQLHVILYHNIPAKSDVNQRRFVLAAAYCVLARAERPVVG